MAPQAFFDYKQFDYEKPLITLDEIRKLNAQRHEMEQLTGIVWVDEENHGVIGYKDITDDEFWIKGHMPGFPLMPGVLMCEAAAQLAAFYARKYGLLKDGDYLGFGGMESVRFRSPVYPPARLIICARAARLRRIRAEFDFQGFVDDQLIFHGRMIGVPISRDRNPES
ncbi:MAG: beta-hydroxyacyl-ACP dehydratase [Planctomycetota bacterium]|nr:MAG: beta-hydroxyacyl-ACP dehydratase [Planctomycetota bacterium]REJ94678.1 MAG: beta-hydroxyacyl-ACP dehydratase [Planctomycetota bacterium]REK31362.1 MAG: beta-hydroxyacyl-ACP dehydratase [Planctomycetota bacterium]REK39087.1 MAG: beta-hydroxyacyl-ACP dehydratase [Planctomycetota bacterium]